ncbi:MAG: hypothetical protein JXA33_11875 [Anaerolineae bacterium]|nr:hypothetical protein [Anaerolineae bacterium]
MTHIADIVGLIIGTVITLMIGSYLIGDNPAFRWALAILVGIGAGYAFGVVVLYLKDWFLEGLGSDNLWGKIYHLVPLLLGILLLLKGFSPNTPLGRLAVLGNISMGFILGIGAAVAVAGALLGTLVPQMLAAGTPFTHGLTGILQGVITILGTITVLLIFSPRSWESENQPHTLTRWIQRIGRGFIIFALAVTFAGALTSALTQWVMGVWDFAKLLETLAPLIGS